MKKIIPLVCYILALLPVSALAQTTPAITFVSSKNVNDIINITIQSPNSFTIDWGDGTPVPGSEGTNSHALLGSKTVKIYGSGISSMYCDNNGAISIDVSNCPDLVNLTVQYNELTSIDISKNTKLEFFSVLRNQISSIDLSNNTALNSLYLSGNPISSVDLSACTSLSSAIMENCSQLASLDVSKNTELKTLICRNTIISSLDITALSKLDRLDCSNCNLSSINLSGNPLLNTLTLLNNKDLTELDLSKQAALSSLTISYTKVNANEMIINSSAQLKTLYCGSTGITTFDITKFPYLIDLDLSNNKISAVNLQSTTLKSLYIAGCNLISIGLGEMPNLLSLNCDNSTIMSIVCPSPCNLTSLYANNTYLTSLNLSNFPKLTNLSLSKNNVGLKLLPPDNGAFRSYNYIPQNTLVVDKTVPVGYTVDLSSQLKSSGAQTVFTWKTKGGITLVDGTDYTISSGIVKFLKAQSDSVYCEISNAQYPKLTGNYALKTSYINVSSIPFAGDGSENNPFQIATLSDLRFLSESPVLWQYYYVQTANIDAADTKNWNNGKGFSPIGAYPSQNITAKPLKSYDGQFFTISNLYINRPDESYTEISAGLFGNVDVVENLGVLNVDIKGDSPVGAIAGYVSQKIRNCYSTGKVIGSNMAGGLIGVSGSNAIVENCYSTVNLASNGSAGGLIGTTGTKSIKNCYARGTVTGRGVGGLISEIYGPVSFCYSTGTVINSAIPASYYSKGGFGASFYTGSGYNGVISKCFWDITTSGISEGISYSSSPSNPDLTGSSTANMKLSSTFTNAGWDFKGETANGTEDIWTIYPGINDGYPCFVWQTPVPHVLTGITTKIKNVTAIANGILVDKGTPAATSYGFCWSTTANPTIANSKTDLGTPSATGSYNTQLSGLTPVTTYYIRAFAQNSQGISYGKQYSFTTSNKIQLGFATPAEVTLVKPYDGTTAATIKLGALTGVEAGDDVKVSATATFNDANAGKGKSISVIYTISGTSANKYFEPEPETFTNAEITRIQLSIGNPVVVAQKVYDGTSNSVVSTVGNLTGVITADAGKVSVSSSALYDNANAGSNKTIVVKYQLSGVSSANYIAPSDYTIKTGNISKVQLSIGAPTVVTGKLYDGTADAAITGLGILSGVIAADEADITVSAKASYNDAGIGEGKPITVVYTIAGQSVANYIAPDNYVINTGVIEDKIVLAAIDPITAICGESEVNIPYAVLQGKPLEYQIIFGDKAKAQGFANIAYTALPTGNNNTLIIAIPNGAAGTFEASLQMKSVLSTGDVYPFTFTVNLSSALIKTKFTDVVLFDNSSNNYTSYQWYKEGSAITGATKQYYNDKAGLSGSYQVKVTNRANETLMTCPVSLSLQLKSQPVITAYPNALSPSQEFKVKMDNLTDDEVKDAELTLFNAFGTIVYKQKINTPEVSLSAPAAYGSYIGHVVTKDGAVLSFRIIVNQ